MKKVKRDLSKPLSPTNGDDKPKKKKNKPNTMFDYGNVHTGTNSTNPGVSKAKSDKKKRDALLAKTKAQADVSKAKAISKAKSDKKKR